VCAATRVAAAVGNAETESVGKEPDDRVEVPPPYDDVVEPDDQVSAASAGAAGARMAVL
jgi:hypothetical protein